LAEVISISIVITITSVLLHIHSLFWKVKLTANQLLQGGLTNIDFSHLSAWHSCSTRTRSWVVALIRSKPVSFMKFVTSHPSQML